MKLSELKAFINSVDEDDGDVEIVIFVETDTAKKAKFVNFEKILLTDCRAELIPSQPIRLV